MDSETLAIVRDLEQLTTNLTSQAIVQCGVDLAERATSSRIAYLHFLNPDQKTLELGAWSHDTLSVCTAVYDRHYPIDAAGVWADAARERRPCVNNDYQHQSGRRGLPEGHVRLIRHLGVPVIHDGLVRMLVGVGNKASDYVAGDIELLAIVAQRVWSVLTQRRVLEHYLDVAARSRQMQQVAWICGLEYDVSEDLLDCDTMWANVFGLGRGHESPRSLAGLLAFVALEDRERVSQALTLTGAQTGTWRVRCLRASGEPFPAELTLEFHAREIGLGWIANGTLRDLSQEAAIEALRHRADTDPLTGLPNRNVLTRLLENEGDRRKPAPGLAFHYIDLDDFKPVNDTHGHLFGDEVLRVVAERLRRTTRQGDVILRMGGDEFAVVQVGVEGVAEALLLADAMIEAVGEPIVAHGRTLVVGASIGIALSADGTTRLEELSVEADRALYRAKALGGRRSVISGSWEA